MYAGICGFILSFLNDDDDDDYYNNYCLNMFIACAGFILI